MRSSLSLPIRVELAYRLMTVDRQAQFKSDVLALADANGLPLSEMYFSQVVSGQRSAPCSEQLGCLISEYLIGKGFHVPPSLVTGTQPVLQSELDVLAAPLPEAERPKVPSIRGRSRARSVAGEASEGAAAS